MANADAPSAPIETHPFEPFLPPAAKILLMGSFPPPRKRWKMEFYYPNLQNDMWRIFGLVFFGNAAHFLTADGKNFQVGAITRFLAAKGIALSDSGYRVRRLRNNAADNALQIVQSAPLAEYLSRIPQCSMIAATGNKAAQTLIALLPENAGICVPRSGKPTCVFFAQRALTLHLLPSSSRAYPLPLAQKAAAYAAFFREAGLLKNSSESFTAKTPIQ